MPAISIVIATFNSERYIEACLRSIFNQDCLDLEVIVVDNGSGDSTIELIRRGYPGVILIKNSENRGASSARNQGIRASSADWILSLDCDAVLKRNLVSEVLKATEDLPYDVGALQPKTFNHDDSVIYSCGIHLSWLRRFYDLGRGEKDNGRFVGVGNIFGASSSCALYRRKMLEDIKEKTGYFDERFFFLVEDVDLAWRAERRGWKAVFYPQAVCYHYGNSSDFNRRLRQYLCFRNRYYLMIKNEGLKRFYMNLMFLCFYDFPRFMHMLLTNPYTVKALREVRSFIEHDRKRQDSLSNR